VGLPLAGTSISAVRLASSPEESMAIQAWERGVDREERPWVPIPEAQVRPPICHSSVVREGVQELQQSVLARRNPTAAFLAKVS